jgi:hypothetical protein
VINKQEIEKEMKEVAQRKPGNSRLVYSKSTKTIVVINQLGQIVRDTGLTLREE